MFEIIQLLAANRLPFQGSYNKEKSVEESIFMSIYNFTLQKDEKFAVCASQIPKNALYTSPEIQNEIIQVLAELVRDEVVKEVQSADVPYYTLFLDGTRNKNHTECLVFHSEFAMLKLQKLTRKLSGLKVQ